MISILQLINDRTKGSNPGLLKIYLGHVTHALLSMVCSRKSIGCGPKTVASLEAKYAYKISVSSGGSVQSK